MPFCNECDESFSRKDSLVRHHRRRHPNSGTLPSLLRNLSVSTTATDRSYEPNAKLAKADTENGECEEIETDDEIDVTASSTYDQSSDESSNASDDDDI